MIFRLPIFAFIILFFSSGIKSQYIKVDTNYTPDELVKNIFFGNQNTSCISVDNVTINGKDFGGGNKSYGYFSRNGSSFEIEDGIILSTGSALEAVGPNNFIQTERRGDPFADSSWGGDQDLINTLNQAGLNSENILNATVLEFDFTSYKSTGVSFDYMFLSEEYRPDNCRYSDAFAFLIKKADNSTAFENIAVIPGTNIPVTSNTIHGTCENGHPEYFGSFNDEQTPTNFHGQTKTLSAKANIELGVTYHIKLVIADHGDQTGLYDSAVFLKAGSFLGNKNLGTDRLLSNGSALCENSTLTLNATTSSGATYQWYKDGAIIPGENFATFTIEDPGFYEVEIDDAGCKIKGSIKIEYAEKPIVLEKKFCNYNDGNPISINLQELNPELISNYKDYFEVKYYRDAGPTNLLPNEFTYSEDTTIFVQVKSGDCLLVDKKVHLQTPQKSLILDDQTICSNSVTTLKTEGGFNYYKWMRENGTVIDEGRDAYYVDENIGVGKYTVELTSMNDCKLIQEVEVFAAELPKITNIDINGSTATVFVTGGNPPYEYSLDNSSFQSSNIFTNIPRGLHTMYVRDSINCEIIEKEFLIINLINVITPNGDGQNDYLDYSDLSIKKDVKIEIFDRFGSRVFLSNNNQFIWDGKTMNGRPLSTGNYWFLLSWIEPDTNLPVSYNGWILLKNRN